MNEVGAIPDSIYLLQEPYYRTNGVPGVRKPKNFYSHSRTSRAAIYVSALSTFTFVQMPQFTGEDITVGSIEGGCLKDPVIIASIYLEYEKPSVKPVVLPLMGELIDFCTTRQIKLICGIDCNSHSPLWGCDDTNKRGEVLEEYIFQKRLFVHNIGSEPTWAARGFSSIIDITVSLNLGDEISQWKVCKKHIADHYMISFVLDSIQNHKVWSRNYNRAKWPLFTEFISSNLKEAPHLWSEDIVESALNHLYVIIEKGLDQACPKHKVKKKDLIVWWNQDCENARGQYLSLRNKIRRLHRKNKLPPDELLDRVRLAHRKYKYITRNSKRESFRELVRETNSVPAMAKLNKILDRKESSHLGMVTKSDGSSTSNTGETLRVMLDEHFPGSENIIELDVRSSFEGDARPIDSLEWITNARIRRALNQFKPHKTAGPDGLKPIALRQLPEAAITYIRHIYTACIEIEFSPIRWCHSIVLFMPKQGKKSYKEPRSFRPLSLTSFLFKGLERLAVWRIEETALIERPLHSKQFAFRKNMSTDHALTGALNTIESALFRQKMVITIDIDIKGAFDNIATEAILMAMENRKIEHNITSWYGDYLNNRTCETTLGGSTANAKLNRGCPQGGVASPVVAWNLPYDSFLEAYDGSAVVQFGFADDGKLIITGVDFQMMLKVAQWAIDVAVKWAEKVGVTFSTEKSNVMFFNQGLFQPVVETLTLYGKILKWTNENKYLGIIFDNQLSFKRHIESRIASAKRKLMMLGNVFRNTWGPHPAAARWAYTGIVRPALVYGSIIWADKAQKENIKAKLSSLQRLALLQIAPVRKSTPTAALELLYNIMPLHLYIREHALKSAVRVGIDPGWEPCGKKGHQHLLLESLPNEVSNLKSDNHRTTMIWEQNYFVKIGDGSDIPHRDWKCYTDGSKIGIKAGSGGIILHRGQKFRDFAFSVGKAEVFQAELCAILASAKILITHRVTNSKIDIMVDSQAALLAIANPHTSSDLVRTVKIILNELGFSNEIVLNWIEAHKGWEFNELADIQAKKGVYLEELPSDVPLPSKRSIHLKIELLVKKEWEILWEKSPDYRQTKYFIGGPSKVIAKLLIQNSREVLGRLVRFLTGHAFLRRQNAIVFHGINPPPGDISCRFCEDIYSDETPHHLITECDRFCHWRGETLGAYILDEFPDWEVTSLIKFLSHKEIILAETE